MATYYYCGKFTEFYVYCLIGYVFPKKGDSLKVYVALHFIPKCLTLKGNLKSYV